MLANGVLWRPLTGAPGRVMLLLSADLAEAIQRRLSMFVLRAKVVIQDARDRTWMSHIDVNLSKVADLKRAVQRSLPD